MRPTEILIVLGVMTSLILLVLLVEFVGRPVTGWIFGKLVRRFPRQLWMQRVLISTWWVGHPMNDPIEVRFLLASEDWSRYPVLYNHLKKVVLKVR